MQNLQPREKNRTLQFLTKFDNLSKQYACTICLKTFKEEKQLQIHKSFHFDKSSDKKVIKNLKLIVCKYCDRKFASTPSLEAHIIDNHADSDDGGESLDANPMSDEAGSVKEEDHDETRTARDASEQQNVTPKLETDVALKENLENVPNYKSLLPKKSYVTENGLGVNQNSSTNSPEDSVSVNKTPPRKHSKSDMRNKQKKKNGISLVESDMEIGLKVGPFSSCLAHYLYVYT